VTEPERFFFVHLQKTGGTALFRRLRHHFGLRGVYPMPEYQGSPETSLGIDALVARFARHRDEIRVVTGHFPLCTVDLLPARFTTFTVLREPVARTLSFLRHQRKEEPRFRDAPLSEIYADPVCREGLIRNHMVRMLSLEKDEMTDGALTPIVVDRGRLDAAKRNLSERIDATGLQEDLDGFCDALAARFGWDLGPPQLANRTAHRDRDEASPDLRARIADDNAMDVELYRFAVGLVGAGRP
jgi:hypothetical protein